MKTTIVITAIAAVLSLGGAQAADNRHRDVEWTTRYHELEGFYHVVADKRFVGSFAPERGQCSVSMLVGPADESDANVEPIRLSFDLGASQSISVASDKGRSLSVACTKGANALDISTVTHAKEAAQTD